MRRTGLTLAAAVYIQAVTIQVVSAFGLGELGEFTKSVSSFTENVSEELRPVAEFSEKAAATGLEPFVDLNKKVAEIEGALKPVVELSSNVNDAVDVLKNHDNNVFVFNTIGYPNPAGTNRFFTDLRVAGFKGDGEGLKSSLTAGALVALASGRQDLQNIAQRIRPFFSKPLEGAKVSLSYKGVAVGGSSGFTPDKPIGTLGKDGNLKVRLDFKNQGEYDRYSFVTTVNYSTPLRVETLVHTYPQSGFGVISDIDDTIKVTDVLAPKEMVKNTFVKDYTPEDGMVKFYQFLRGNITVNTVGHPVFYYLSGSPWQLYQSLERFLTYYFPTGELILNDLDFKDPVSMLQTLNVLDYKLTEGRKVLQKFPLRKFVLIGDSSQKDPEVYGQLFREFPTQIACILIRREAVPNNEVAAALNQDNRFAEAFKGVPLTNWDVFDKGSDLEGKVDYQKACRR